MTVNYRSRVHFRPPDRYVCLPRPPSLIYKPLLFPPSRKFEIPHRRIFSRIINNPPLFCYQRISLPSIRNNELKRRVETMGRARCRFENMCIQIVSLSLSLPFIRADTDSPPPPPTRPLHRPPRSPRRAVYPGCKSTTHSANPPLCVLCAHRAQRRVCTPHRERERERINATEIDSSRLEIQSRVAN